MAKIINFSFLLPYLRCFACIFLLLPALTHSASALSIENKAFKNLSLFGIEFVESEQEFFAKVSAIQSIALQEYVTSAFRVTELNIEVVGMSSQVRIYATEVLDVNEVAAFGTPQGMPPGAPPMPPMPESVMGASKSVRESFAPAVVPVDVVKTYPITTHARTIEFQLSSRDGVQELYTALRNRWIGMEDEEEEKLEEEDMSEKAREEDTEKDPRYVKQRIVRNDLNGVLFIVD